MLVNSAPCVTMKKGDWIILKTGAVVRVCDDDPMHGDTVLVDLEAGLPRAVLRESIVSVQHTIKLNITSITKR